MSVTTAPVGSVHGVADPAPPVRRVRHQARETAALMMFSAATSTAVAVLLLLLVSLGS